MEEGNFNYQIQVQNNNINNSLDAIKNFESDIEELENLKRKLENIQTDMCLAARNTILKVNNISGGVGFSFGMFNLCFFDKLINVVKGNDYDRAEQSLLNAQNKVQKKINELNTKIANEYQFIQKCKINIKQINIQTTEYLKNKGMCKNEFNC